MVTRSYIFMCANKNCKPNFNNLIHKIENTYKEQFMISRLNQNIEKFNKHWLIFKNIF